MAEIKIERKKNVWPWVLVGLIIVTVLAYYLVFRDSNYTRADYSANTNNIDLLKEKDNKDIIAAYVNFIENNKDQMSLDHAYTKEALEKLVDATNAKANQLGYDVQGELGKAMNYAKMITDDPFETTHADNIRKTSDIITNVLQNIQKAHYPNLANDIEELKYESQSINPDILTLDQKDAVKNYFAKASLLLQKMNK